MRLASPKVPTQKLADTSHLFGEIRHTDKPYVVVPLHSSENRAFVPIGYFDAGVICGNANSMLPDASLYDFGLLCSTMHNAWMRTVCGRLKSDYRYSNTIVYNNFVWPQQPSDKQRKATFDTSLLLRAWALETNMRKIRSPTDALCLANVPVIWTVLAAAVVPVLAPPPPPQPCSARADSARAANAGCLFMSSAPVEGLSLLLGWAAGSAVSEAVRLILFNADCPWEHAIGWPI
jgi:hypothetical protein